MKLIDLFRKLKVHIDKQELFPVKMSIEFKQGHYTYVVPVQDIEFLYDNYNGVDVLSTIYFKGETSFSKEDDDKELQKQLKEFRILGGEY